MPIAVDALFVLLFVLIVVISAKRGLAKPTLPLLRIAVSAIGTTLLGSVLASRLEFYMLDDVTQRVTERLTFLPSAIPSVSQGLTTLLAILISYALLFLLLFALMTLVNRLIRKLTHLPVIRSIDRVLGGVAGIALGALAVAVLSSLLRVGLLAAGQEELVASSLFLSLLLPVP